MLELAQAAVAAAVAAQAQGQPRVVWLVLQLGVLCRPIVSD